jgi:hypothetical protein
MSESKPKASGPPHCKICNHAHWGVAHVWGGRSPAVASPSGKASGFGPDTAGSSPAATANSPAGRGGAKKRASPSPAVLADAATGKVTIVHHRAHALSDAGRKAIADAALADVEARTSKKPKPKKKRKSPVVAKDGTNRGRPKGKKPFDKKRYDRERAAARRAAKKGAEPKGEPPK